MKKILFLTIAAMGLMSSCAEDDVPGMGSYDGTAIAFSTQTGEETRSASTLTTLDKFTVTAVNADGTSYYNSETYNYNAASGVFVSTTPHYWPLNGTLSFYAINEPGTVSYDANGVPSYTYSDWAAKTDLVAATVLSGEKTIPYPMAFHHLTSQIRVTAEPENKTEELTYKLMAVRMKAPAQGVYSFANATGGVGTWSITNSKTKTYAYSEGIGNGLTCTQNGNITMPGTYWNILPTTDGKLSFEVEYQVYENGKLISDFTGDNMKTCAVATPSLEAGKMYTYNFVLSLGSDDVISFTTTVRDWDTASTTDLTPTTPVISHDYVTLTFKPEDVSSMPVEAWNTFAGYTIWSAPLDRVVQTIYEYDSFGTFNGVDADGNITLSLPDNRDYSIFSSGDGTLCFGIKDGEITYAGTIG